MSQPKLMVVDDLPAACEVIKGMLEDDYEIETANSGEQGLALVENFHPDVVVLDVIMPGIGGYEVCRRLKTGSDTASIKVIMISANAVTAESREAGYQVGADDYLVKPFIHQDLFAKVQVWSRIKQAEDLLKIRLNALEGERDSYQRLQNLKSDVAPLVVEMIRKIQAVSGENDLLAEHILSHYKSDLRLCGWSQETREKAQQASRLATQLFSLFQKI